MRRCVPVAAAIVILWTAACGQSQQEKQIQNHAEQIEKSADQMQKGAEDMAKGFADMAKGLSVMAANNPNQKPVNPVSFKELQTVMPEVPGWERATPTGERMTSPFSFSQASVTYKKGDAEIEQKIMDSGFNQLLFTPFTMFMAAGYEKETQDGFERSVNIAGNPGWEKWDKGSKNGELSVVVGKRFLVQVEGHDVDDIKTLHAVLDQTDLTKLTSLK